MRPQVFAMLTVLTGGMLAGCLDETRPSSVDPSWNGPELLQQLPLPVFDGERLTIDVPVPVLLVGYPDGTAANLQALAEPTPVDHWAGDLNEVWPPDPEAEPIELVPLAGGQSFPMPIVPVANFIVADAPAALNDEFGEFLNDARRFAVSDDRLSAGAAEDWFADALSRHVIAFDAAMPGIIIMHLESFDIGPHEWQYALPHGTLDGERTWGGKYPFLIFDASAKPDQFGTEQTFTGTLRPDDLAPLVDMLVEASHFRLLQGAIYPAPRPTCHAVTMILGWRPTSLAGTGLLNVQSSVEVFHPEEIGRGLENLTRQTVHVDTKVLELPVDDPILDAMARGEVATLEAQRAWFEENWESYHVSHEGCEPYLAFVVDGDSASTPTSILGIGTYDESKGHRIAFGWVNELMRYTLGDPWPRLLQLDLYGSKDYYTWIDYLFIHELGHIFSMRHAHDITRHDGQETTYESTNNWEPVWDPMSYRTDGRVLDFGAIAANNYARNRASFLLQDAFDQGHEGSAEWTDAWNALVQRDWDAAAESLSPLINL